MDEPIRDLGRKSYLGDGAYADYDGESLLLTTENGEVTTNRVVLGPAEVAKLGLYIIRLQSQGDEADHG